MSWLNPVYKRVLLKISGEALAGDQKRGLDFDIVRKVCQSIKTCIELGVEIGVVVGGGNFSRGMLDGGGKMDRTRADHMGMMATVMNCLAVADMLEQINVPVQVQTALDIKAVAEPYVKLKADKYLSNGNAVIFGCGTGNPYFSTDTAAVLRAAEIGAEVILLAKNVDGVYTADPKKDPNARRLESITYADMLAQRLTVMDLTAASLALDNDIPVILFALHDPDNIVRVVTGEQIGTRVSCG